MKPKKDDLSNHPLYQHVKQFQQSMLDTQRSGLASIASLDNSRGHRRIVSLHIPEFRRWKSREVPGFVPYVTIMGGLLEVQNSAEQANLGYDVCAGSYGMLPSVRIPDEVESCGPFIITCVDQSPKWDPKKLLIMLFLQGLGDAVFTSDYSDYFWDYTVQHAQQVRLSKLFTSSRLVLMSFNAQDQTADFVELWHESYKLLTEVPNSNIAMLLDQSQGQLLDHVHQTFTLSLPSNLSSPASFMTANSPAAFIAANSPASFMTARSSYASPALAVINEYSSSANITTIRENEPPDPSLPAPIRRLHNDYYQGLRSRQIFQPFDKELNWSGKGQHVTFAPQDDVPLVFLSHLGSSLTAKVDKMLCRRIALARKMMRCTRQWKITDALDEVYHLQNLRHAHIVQLVGTYLQGRNFSILLYPAADYHLGQFLEDTSDIEQSPKDLKEYRSRLAFLVSALGCLASAISSIHEHTTKHMDIKPQNILVRRVFPDGSLFCWRLYIADFGLSRSFAAQGHSQTDGPTARTPRYCAPEVFRCEQRGRAADIFSLGCVYLEIMTVYNTFDLQDFADARKGLGDDESFHGNLTRVLDWIANMLLAPAVYTPRFRFNFSSLAEFKTLVDVVQRMVHEDADQRPTASSIVKLFSEFSGNSLLRPGPCCSSGPEPYDEYVPPPGLGVPGYPPPPSGNKYA